MPRKRSEKHIRHGKIIVYACHGNGIKRVRGVCQNQPKVAAVNWQEDALLAKYNVFVRKTEYEADCLIDTGATISVMNYNTWVKLGKPQLRTSGVGNILLGNNVQVQYMFVVFARHL